MKRKPANSGHMAGPIMHEGAPLDFSFLKLTDVKSLEKEKPRGGIRIPIEKDDDEEEAKKEKVAGEDDKGADDAKEGSKVTVVKNAQAPKVMEILTGHSISLTQQKTGAGASRKTEDGGEEDARKKENAYSRTALLLNNN